MWISAFMIVMVTCMALLFAFTDVMADRLYGNKRLIFIFVMAAYSIYRAFRLKQLFKESKSE
jgi:Na+/alanine symporter